MNDTDPLVALSEAGVSVWLDDLSRQRLTSGNLAGLASERHIVGLTSNPTTFAAAVADADEYQAQVRELAARGATVDEAVREITVADVQQACDLFSGTWESTAAVDGRVSLEVDPRLAHDTEATVEQAADLWKIVDRPNLMIKIPGTAEGLPAISRSLADGISVNVTLIFSVERYREVMNAFFDGLEQARSNGHDLSMLGSVASFFVSRVDAEIDRRLTEIGTDAALELRGRAALANARLAYAAHREAFESVRWATLEDGGALRQRPLWASTGVKNPDYPDTLYVTELVAPDVVNTMPEKTLQAFADHGEVLGDRVSGRDGEARDVFDALAAAGVDLADVFAVLERDGVEKFAQSWQELLETTGAQLSKAAS